MASDSAIVTLVTSEDFVIGAQVLAHSLICSNPLLQELDHIVFAVLVTANIKHASRRLLLSSGFDRVIEVDAIPNPSPASSVHVASWHAVGFTKLRIWSLTQFAKVLYIDADCVVLRDVTHLLTAPRFAKVALAAAPDVFPPDHFNAGVMLCEVACVASYDGGDTGLLNACSLFRRWFDADSAAPALGVQCASARPIGGASRPSSSWCTSRRPSRGT